MESRACTRIRDSTDYSGLSVLGHYQGELSDLLPSDFDVEDISIEKIQYKDNDWIKFKYGLCDAAISKYK